MENMNTNIGTLKHFRTEMRFLPLKRRFPHTETSNRSNTEPPNADIHDMPGMVTLKPVVTVVTLNL